MDRALAATSSRRSCQDVPADRPGHFCIGDLNACLALDLGPLRSRVVSRFSASEDQPASVGLA